MAFRSDRHQRVEAQTNTKRHLRWSLSCIQIQGLPSECELSKEKERERVKRTQGSKMVLVVLQNK